ncbi:MAG: hypothetical protein AAGK02_00405 [Pseudomonadota bacterium]
MFDKSSLPVPATLLGALILYFAASAIAGQVIATRTIDKSAWHVTCADGIKAAARPPSVPKTITPQRRCTSTIGIFHRDLARLCLKFGDPDFNEQARRLEREARARKKALADQRVARAAASAGTRCRCAANVYKAEQMIPLAIYAGSARQISLPPVEDLEDGLRQALATPRCQALGDLS